jgi:hypothetical protein
MVFYIEVRILQQSLLGVSVRTIGRRLKIEKFPNIVYIDYYNQNNIVVIVVVIRRFYE